MNVLFILNEAPYGSEKIFNALRLAIALQKEQPDTEIRIFLLADAVTSVIPTQQTPQGYYNVEKMLKAVISNGGKVKLCGTCCDARGVKTLELPSGQELSNMSELAQWIFESSKVLVF